MDYFSVYQHDQNGELQDVVSLLPPDHVMAYGLGPESVVGVLAKSIGAGGAVEPSNFARNSVFVRFLHELIARRAPSLPTLQQAAKRQVSGAVYVIDRRTRTPDGSVPPEDIIGAFTVNEGRIVADSYQPNRHHRILSENGFFELEASLMTLLREDLAALK